MSDFHIVYRPENWDSHDTDHLHTATQKLATNNTVAQARGLETAAERFRPSQALLNAINAALAARVPLLLTGEPGTGKTQVAWFLKRFFRIKLFEYQVRSNSQAADLRYDFDAVAYLRDAYLAQHPHPNPSPSEGEGLYDPRSPA